MVPVPCRPGLQVMTWNFMDCRILVSQNGMDSEECAALMKIVAITYDEVLLPLPGIIEDGAVAPEGTLPPAADQ